MVQRLKLFYLEKVFPELQTQMSAKLLKNTEQSVAKQRRNGFAAGLRKAHAPGNAGSNASSDVRKTILNRHQIPQLEKIIINRGIGEASQNTKLVETSVDEITSLSSQKAVVTKSRKAIAGFKIREGVPVGIVVTLRGERMYGFLDRLIHLALPRIRDFQGLNPKSFDGHGNYSLGFKEQLMFPEIVYEKVSQARGLDISIVTTAHTDEEGLALLSLLGMPFTSKS
jgi:large subunit ribosomal protein L5